MRLHGHGAHLEKEKLVHHSKTVVVVWWVIANLLNIAVGGALSTGNATPTGTWLAQPIIAG